MRSINLASKTPKTGTECFISGWGATRSQQAGVPNLRYATVDVLDFRKCQKSLAETLHTGVMCAGDWNGEKDACNVNIIDYFSTKSVRPNYIISLKHFAG